MATKKLSPTGRRPRAEAVGESERPNTQALILDAAEQLFAAQGYGGTSIRQIAEAAGSTPEARLKTLHSRFGHDAFLKEERAIADAITEFLGS